MSNLINKTKWGDCSRCPAVNTNVVKLGKDLVCLQCNKDLKVKQQITKANQRNAVRGLINKSAEVNQDAVDKEKWFRLIRINLTGTCQCGCGNPSSKKDDKYFRFSCCHLFPKKDFHSIKYHPLNYVERAFWGGCHTNLDEQGMDKWVNMADWDDIKEKFYELAPLLTDEERSFKFYAQLEKLVYGK